MRASVCARAEHKPPEMFQWDVVDTSPDLRGKNVLKTFEVAIRHDRRATRSELERVLCRWTYFHLRSKILRGGNRNQLLPLMVVRVEYDRSKRICIRRTCSRPGGGDFSIRRRWSSDRYIYSQSSTKPVNFAKTGPVDAEIIGLAEITKIYKHKQNMSPPRLPFAQSGCAKGVQVTLTQTLIL